MPRKIIFVFLFFSVLIFSCHTRARTVRTQCGHNPTITKLNNDTSKIEMVIIDRNSNMADTGVAYIIDSMKINNDILSLFVKYSGGCGVHSFQLFSNGAYAKSLPPQTSVCLRHTNKEDACRQLISEELKFNISKLKYQGQNTVIINIGKSHRINYTSK